MSLKEVKRTKGQYRVLQSNSVTFRVSGCLLKLHLSKEEKNAKKGNKTNLGSAKNICKYIGPNLRQCQQSQQFKKKELTSASELCCHLYRHILCQQHERHDCRLTGRPTPRLLRNWDHWCSQNMPGETFLNLQENDYM